jgi:hypothetical protein
MHHQRSHSYTLPTVSQSTNQAVQLQMMLRCHRQPPKKSSYNRWDTRIKMLDIDKDGKDTNLKALKLVRRFIKDCGYLDRHCCPVNPFPC